MDTREGELIHVEFVRVMTFNAMLWLVSLYRTAKWFSGPLRPLADFSERAFALLLGPLFQKASHLFEALLLFLDTKVGEAVDEISKLVPSPVKKVVGQAYHLVDKSVEVTDNLFRVARGGGLPAVVRYVRTLAKNLAIETAAWLWFTASEIPLLHGVAYKALFPIARWTDKYNSLVSGMAGKGYSVSRIVPLFPLEDFAHAYKRAENAAAAAAAGVEDKDASSDGDYE